MKRNCSHALALSVALAASMPMAAPAGAQGTAPPRKLALSGARIVPVAGEVIEKGTILIVDGRIAAIDADVELPYDAVEVELGAGSVLFPGLVNAHDSGGLDVANENRPVTPYVDVYDALDPSSLFFEESLREGVTSIHVMAGNNCAIGGVSRVVHPIGRTPDEMTLRPDVGLKLSVSPHRGYGRMLQLVTLRETFRDLDEYLEGLAEQRYEEEVASRGETISVGPAEAQARGRPLLRDEDLDDAHRNLVRLRDGRLAAWVWCETAMDIAPAVEFARSQGFFDRLVLVLGPATVDAAAEIREAGRPVVLGPELVHQVRDPLTGEIEETFVPAVFHREGVRFALLADPRASLAERYLNYQAARCVREGVARDEALRAVTLHPAQMLGLESEIGSLEVGKVANIVVFSGDPLAFDSWVQKVYIRGVLAYEKERDVRLETLLSEAGASPSGAAATGGTDAASERRGDEPAAETKDSAAEGADAGDGSDPEPPAEETQTARRRG